MYENSNFKLITWIIPCLFHSAIKSCALYATKASSYQKTLGLNRTVKQYPCHLPITQSIYSAIDLYQHFSISTHFQILKFFLSISLLNNFSYIVYYIFQLSYTDMLMTKLGTYFKKNVTKSTLSPMTNTCITLHRSSWSSNTVNDNYLVLNASHYFCYYIVSQSLISRLLAPISNLFYVVCRLLIYSSTVKK